MKYEAPDFISNVYRQFFRALKSTPGLWISLFFGNVFRRCTPAFAEPFCLNPALPRRTVSCAIVASAMFFCLGMTAMLCALSGTLLHSQEEQVIHFLCDRWNLLLYVVVCPGYVLFCIRLVILALERPEGENTQAVPVQAVARLFVSIFLIILFSSVLITNYIVDASDPSIIADRYWFFDDRNGVRVLNAAGLYYIVLNFTLLVLTFLGGASFISISIDGMALARSLTDSQQPMQFDQYKQRIDRLVRAYRYGVGLVLFYALNLIVWKVSPLHGTTNMDIAGALFTLVGLFFVAVPRRFVQHVWAEYCMRRAAAVGEAQPVEAYKDVIANRDTRLFGLLQILCISSWFSKFYEIDVDPLYYFMELLRP